MEDMSRGRKPKKIEIEETPTFLELSREYKENINNDINVEALNMLDNIDRNLFIMFIINDNCITYLANELHCSQPLIRKHIREIREKIKCNIDKINER